MNASSIAQGMITPSIRKRLAVACRAALPRAEVGRRAPKGKKVTRFPALLRACHLAGGQAHLGAHLGMSQATVWSWLYVTANGVAAEYVLKIEEITGVSRYELRPDIYVRED